MKEIDKFKILKEYETNLMHVIDLLGDGETNNLQLNKLGKHLFGNRFIGVFTSDKIIKLKNNEMCIVNTDPSNKKGLHWTALCVYKDKVYFYDTFNRNYKKLSKNWLNKKWINANKDRDESYKEANCGQKSICWLISFQKHGPKIINII